MSRTSVVVIGAGQAGLAVSHHLTGAGVEHVVLERDRVAGRWSSYRWEALRLLTPNWLSRLPDYRYAGPEPDGFMSATGVADYLRSYARHSGTPVVEGAEVRSVERHAVGYQVISDAGRWLCDAVVVATGWCDVPRVPGFAAALDPRIEQLTAATYRNPAALPDGGVLVVGASATGVQIADELARSGRRVTLAVGSHTRLPRHYRGADIMWWLDAMGLFDRRLDGHPAPAAARDEPSLQLVGGGPGREVDLRSLQQRRVGLAGRLRTVDGTRVRFAPDLPETTGRADARLRRLLRRVDAYALGAGLAAEVEPAAPVRPARTRGAPAGLDLHDAGIGSVVWATGYRRAYPWLRVPVRTAAGEIRQVDGATPVPGLYVMGMRWQSRRSSSFLDGVRHDAATVAGRVLDHLGATLCGRAA